MTHLRSILMIAGYALCSVARAGVFDPDLTYGTQGQVSFPTGPQAFIHNTIGHSVLQPDGKLVVTGTRTLDAAAARFPNEQFVRRFNVDGTSDAAFGQAGETVFRVLGSDHVNQVLLQADGKIVIAIGASETCAIAGQHDCVTASGVPARTMSAIVRLDTQGRLDATFGNAGIALAEDFYGGYALALQADGKLLILGTTGFCGSSSCFGNGKLARFDVNGRRDPSFNAGAAATTRCAAFGYALVNKPDGRTVVAGHDNVGYGDPSLNPGVCVERLMPDGSPDLSFNPALEWTKLGINVASLSLQLLPADKVLLVGRGISRQNPGGPTNLGPFAIRYDATGKTDPTYGSSGSWFIPLSQDSLDIVGFTFARDGGLYIAGQECFSCSGYPQRYRVSLLKVAENGMPDRGFGADGIVRGSVTSMRTTEFLRDVDDRFLFVGSTLKVDDSTDVTIRRVRGDRPASVAVFEFFNVDLHHYFLTASAEESGGIDAGAAGPGWQRTHNDFRVWVPEAGLPVDAVAVCRFYGTQGRGPNSHFYTANPTECSAVKRDPGWTFEGIAFYVTAPVIDQCSGSAAVYRAYNNGFARNDSNHRYSTHLPVLQAMTSEGWSVEGVAFCGAPN